MKAQFNRESLIKTMLKFAFPIMLSYFVSELYGTIDTFMVGKFVGGSEVAAISIVYPIQKILVALGLLATVGTTTALANAIGEGNRENISRILTIGLRFQVLFILAVSLMVFLFKEPLLVLAGATPSLIKDAETYMNSILIGMVFLTTTGFIGTVILSYGESQVALVSNSIGAIINLILDYILITKFSMGVNGAGIATLFSQVVAFLYSVWKFNRVIKNEGIELHAKISWKILMGIISVGVSAFLVESVDGWVGTALNNFVSRISGEKGVLILGISQRIYMYIFLANFAVAAAMQPIASYAYGAKDNELLKSSMTVGNRLAFLVVMISWGLCILFAPQMVGFFTNDRIVINETIRAFRIMISLVPISSIYYISIFYYQSTKKVKLSLFLSVFRHFGVMLPVAIVLTNVLKMGLMGIWLSYPIADFIVGLISYFLLRNEKKKLGKVERDKGLEVYNNTVAA